MPEVNRLLVLVTQLAVLGEDGLSVLIVMEGEILVFVLKLNKIESKIGKSKE